MGWGDAHLLSAGKFGFVPSYAYHATRALVRLPWFDQGDKKEMLGRNASDFE